MAVVVGYGEEGDNGTAKIDETILDNNTELAALDTADETNCDKGAYLRYRIADVAVYYVVPIVAGLTTVASVTILKNVLRTDIVMIISGGITAITPVLRLWRDNEFTKFTNCKESQ